MSRKMRNGDSHHFIFILISITISALLLYCMYISWKYGENREKKDSVCLENYYETHTPSFFTTLINEKDPKSSSIKKEDGYWIIPSFSGESEQTYVDDSKELKNIFTDFVTQYFFATEDTIYEFMNLTIHTIETMLKQKRFLWNVKEEDMFLVYKGGNILRKVFI